MQLEIQNKYRPVGCHSPCAIDRSKADRTVAKTIPKNVPEWDRHSGTDHLNEIHASAPIPPALRLLTVANSRPDESVGTAS
jgi:hypothetical protein